MGISDRSKAVNFLDLSISITSNGFTTNLFEKPENLYLYISPASAHPPGVFKGTIIGMIFRFHRLISCRNEFIHQTKKFFYRLMNRGYTATILKPLVQEAFDRVATKQSLTSVTKDQHLYWQTRFFFASHITRLIHQENHPGYLVESTSSIRKVKRSYRNFETIYQHHPPRYCILQIPYH